MSLLRNPFVLPIFVALIASVIALIAAVAVTFSDLNDAAVPDSVWGRSHSYEFRNFLRQRTSGVVSTIDKQLQGALSGINGATSVSTTFVTETTEDGTSVVNTIPSPPPYTPTSFY